MTGISYPVRSYRHYQVIRLVVILNQDFNKIERDKNGEKATSLACAFFNIDGIKVK
jgi:hypothetical protein